MLICLQEGVSETGVLVAFTVRAMDDKAAEVCQGRAQPQIICMQEGVTETGVSLAFTVRAMDAGPILPHERVR